jgi:SSS family solute:Na+ symporter
MPEADVHIPVVDLLIIIAYLIGILVLGILSSRYSRKSSSDYFLAGRSLRWLMVGAALFATNISTIHLVGLAASGYNDGLVWGNFEWMASFCLILLGLVFAPFYFKSRISTLPEYLEKRYSTGSRTFLAFMAVMAALLIHIGISLYAGAAVFKGFFGIDVIYSILIISVTTAVYTVLGGLKAVVVTESIQTFILLLGAVAVTLFALFALPDHGIHNFEQFKEALKPDQLSMIHPVYNEQGRLNELSWISVLLGYPILGIWYWCSDQTIVQRVLGAKTLRDAQIGPLFAGFLKILPVFLMVLPGVIGYVLFKDVIGEDANQTLPVMIERLIPPGLKGIIAASLLAALMSTIASALNSSATLISVDIVKRLKPGIEDRIQIRIGQVAACVVMVLAMLWSTQGDKFSSIFEAINKIPLCFAPPITCVFFFGVFWSRGTKQASLITLIAGFLVGGVDLLLDLQIFSDKMLITDELGIPFMQQAWWLFCFCSVIYATVSMLTPKPAPEQVENLCWQNPLRAVLEGKLKGATDPRMIAAILLMTMIVMYYLLR